MIRFEVLNVLAKPQGFDRMAQAGPTHQVLGTSQRSCLVLCKTTRRLSTAQAQGRHCMQTEQKHPQPRGFNTLLVRLPPSPHTHQDFL